MKKVLAGIAMAVIGSIGSSATASAESWGAIAYAVTDTKVATAVIGDRPSRAKAEADAIAACERKGAGACKVGTVFNDGNCGYVTTGKGPEGTTGFAVAWGATPKATTANCLAKGAVTCQPPEGICNPG